MLSTKENVLTEKIKKTLRQCNYKINNLDEKENNLFYIEYKVCVYIIYISLLNFFSPSELYIEG